MNEQPVNIIHGDVRKVMRNLPDNHFQTCVTSPPYWGLRDYQSDEQIGAEMTVDSYVENLVDIFREVKRTLKEDGTFWLNIGDSYTSGGRTWRAPDSKNPARGMGYRAPTPAWLKPKELIWVPWKVAFELQKDGWYLRADNIWYKPNCQPESVKDRPTRSHEYLFLLTKSEKYFYDHESVKEPTTDWKTRNRRTVWQVNTQPYSWAHFAVFPPDLVKPCILAWSKEWDSVLDPFFWSWTVWAVCIELGRICTGIEVNKDYIDLAEQRISNASLEQTRLWDSPSRVNRA